MRHVKAFARSLHVWLQVASLSEGIAKLGEALQSFKTAKDSGILG